VVLSEYDVVQPDLLYVSRDRLSIIKEANIWGAPDLVVEILSPSSTKWDREIKREVYARFGVRELWLVDPQARSIEVATLKDGALLTLHTYCVGATLASPLLAGFALDVGGLFA
ncbi:MAG: Uma2 family endonuclease, partial [Bacillota bacterium]